MRNLDQKALQCEERTIQLLAGNNGTGALMLRQCEPCAMMT